MELDGTIGSIEGFYEGKTILITGSTGFVGKVLVEKILRVLPNIKKLYLLMRKSGYKNPTQRLHDEVIGSELFKILRDKLTTTDLISNKVVPVFGDVSFENLGIEDAQLRQQIWNETDIVINSAASTRFDERYDVAMAINTRGVMHLLNFAKKCHNIQMLLHVSTAYVCGERNGVQMENEVSGVSLDMDEEKRLIDEKVKELKSQCATEKEIRYAMKDLGLQRAKVHGWPNTYTFTKAMGEMLVGHMKGTLAVAIVRPTIITSTFREPFPGWVESTRTVDTFIVGGGKGKLKCLLGDPKSSLHDLVPCDMIVNLILVAVAARANRVCDAYIYHASSSKRNPMTFKDLYYFISSYFIQNPYIDPQGNPVIVKPIKVLTSMESFHKYMKLYYIFPLKVFDLVNAILFHYYDEKHRTLKQRIDFTIRLAELYKPYLFSQAIFDDTNAETLRQVSRRSNIDQKVFNFDPRGIIWEEYMKKTHIPGVVKYLF